MHVAFFLPLAILFLGWAFAMKQLDKDDVHEDMIYEPGLSFHMPPLTNHTMKHWNSLKSTVFHKNKLVLVPEIKNSNGMIMNNYVSALVAPPFFN